MVKDDATFLDCLAMVDKQELSDLENPIFPINEGYIHNYLQLFVNIEKDYLYDDVGISAYSPDDEGIMNRFIPIRENIYFNLYPNSEIQLQPDVGC